MPERSIIHWMNGVRAECGAPPGAFVSPYANTVTCQKCIVALKIDVLRRRLLAHQQSVAFTRIRPGKRSKR